MRTEKPKWLENIQYNSWEPELFISGGAIFTLLQIPGFLHKQSILLLQETGFFESVIIAKLLTIAVNGLIAGFSFHLILRGFWIGMVCLSYVFPEGIRHEVIDTFQPIYRDKIKRLREMTDFVVFLEKACSIVFSLSFLFFLVVIGVLIVGLVIVPHSALEVTLGAQVYRVLQITALIVAALGGIYFIDFFCLGAIKRIRWSAKLYYPIYVVFSTLTLAFLYRNAYYTFITNVKVWQSVVAMSSFLLLSVGITLVNGEIITSVKDSRLYLMLESKQHQYIFKHYEDQRKPDQLVETASIPSEFLDQEDYLKVFVVHRKQFEPYMMQICHHESMELADDAKLACFKAFYQLYIDGKRVHDILWRTYQHPETKEKGIIGVTDLSKFGRGACSVEVKLSLPEGISYEEYPQNVYSSIPFWKK